MRADDVYRRYLDTFRDTVGRRGSMRKASAAAGKSLNFFTAQLAEDGLDLKTSLVGAEGLGHPDPGEMLHTAGDRLGSPPTLILECAREGQKLAPDPFWRELRPRVEALVAAGSTEDGFWKSRLGKIEELDQLRRRDRQLAKERLHHLMAAAVQRMEESGERPSQGFGELSRAIGVLAALQRLAGRRDDALDLLLGAYPLARLAGDRGEVEGLWYQKAAYLLVDLSRDARAYRFLLEANKYFFLAGLPDRQTEVMVDTGYVLTHAGEHAEARRILELALPLIPAHDLESRLSVHQTLATNYRELYVLDSACLHLDKAIELVGDNILARAACLWSRAKILLARGTLQEAIHCFHEAMPLHAKLAGAAELAELGMEFATVLQEEKRRPELRSLAADLSGWIQKLRGNRKLRDAIDDFQALIELDKLDTEAFQEIVERVAKASKKKPLLSKIQPIAGAST